MSPLHGGVVTKDHLGVEEHKVGPRVLGWARVTGTRILQE